MKSVIYWGATRHLRLKPVQHKFSYRLFQLGLDLSELETGQLDSFWFGWNKYRILSIWSRDFLGPGGEPQTKKLVDFLSSTGANISPVRVECVCIPRMFGYTFNPVSFYLLYGPEPSRIVGVVAEVNNTFGEKHLYLMQSTSPSDGNDKVFVFEKEFFVSPFFDRSGTYELKLSQTSSNLEISVTLIRKGEREFIAEIKMTALPFNKPNIILTLLRYPLLPILVMLLIHWQAFALWWRRGLSLYMKPLPTGSYTVRSNQSWIHRLRLELIRRTKHIKLI